MKALINIIIGNIQSRQHSVRASKTEFRAGAMEDKVGKCTSNTWECHFYKTNTWECQFCKTNTSGNSFHTVTGTNIKKLQLLDTFYIHPGMTVIFFVIFWGVQIINRYILFK